MCKPGSSVKGDVVRCSGWMWSMYRVLVDIAD